MVIRYLDQTLINQIAAGEVIERPASAIKELVENAIDAGATRIDVIVKDGGRALISVADNGSGMGPEDLSLAVERHATSKIPDGDLFNIRTLGFRGEALPSIGSVSRLTLTSRPKDSAEAWQLVIEGGAKQPLTPASAPQGTRVEVRDLFYATPARLKFLKSATTELNHITDIIYRQALVNPQVSFTLRHDERSLINFTESTDRLNAILGKDFRQNSLEIDFVREETRLKGWISIPSYNRSNSTDQYLFVNGRPVKDKLFATAIKVGYQDVLAGNRYPALCLFLECPPEDVDINVHPAKAEVRFRDSNMMRGFIIAAIRETLRTMATQSSSAIADQAIVAFTPEMMSSVLQREQRPTSPLSFPTRSSGASSYSPRLSMPSRAEYATLQEPTRAYQAAPTAAQVAQVAQIVQPYEQPSHGDSQEDYPLGFAKAQVHQTYIIAETMEQLIIVDQHAAHERIVYEKMKQDLANGLIKRQPLLIPVVVDLTELQQSNIRDFLPDLERLGLGIEIFGTTGLLIREIPTLLNKCDLKQLVLDLVSEIQERGTALTVGETFHEILADKACKNSIRAGRDLSMDEMNALLRQIETTPFSSQCNHGRPTYIKLSKQDLERLFERA